jgi:uncharacterized protein (UPF0335 family)
VLAVSATDLQFKQLIDRILRCREAEDEAKEDTKAVYADLKALGYDKTGAGALVSELRKKNKDAGKFEERNMILDLYRDAYERASHVHAPAHVREERSEGGGTSTHTRAGTVANLDTKPAASLADEIASKVSYREPDVEVVRDDGVMHEVGRVEGSQARLPSDRAENKPSATAVIAGAPSIPDDEVPAFLRPSKPLRPLCLRPDECAGVGHKHCYQCRKAAGLVEAAA